MGKLIFFDLDGTLCTGGGLQVGTEIKEVFNQLRVNDIEPIIATGRSFYEVSDLLSYLEVESFILSNGCYVKYKNQVIQDRQMTKNEIDKVLSVANNNEIVAGFFNQKGYAITSMTELVETHVNYLGIHDVPVDPLFHLKAPVNFMNLYLDEATEMSIKSTIEKEVDIVRFAPLALDILPKGISKGQAIRKLLANITEIVTETYAFGDQNNDLEMFATVDFGVSMRAGTKELKAVASYVAESDDGVIEGLKHFDLI